MTTNIHQQTPGRVNGQLPGRSRPPWGWLGAGILALGVVYWLWGRGDQSILPSSAPAAKASAASSRRSAFRTTLTLPGGATLIVPEGSTSHTLARFLAGNDDVAVPKAFVFDGGHFAVDTSALPPEAEQTVKDVSIILAAYPTTTLQVRGYADNVDNTDAGRTLALGRAETIKRALVNHGIAGSRLTTIDGRGEQPLTRNTTTDEQNNTHHLIVVVMSK